MNIRNYLVFIAIIFVMTTGCGSAENPEPIELTVSAAASMTDALTDIQALFEAKYPDIRIRYNFGGSGALKQQIEQGAPADLFISAANEQMQDLLDKGLIQADKHRILAGNRLVMITSTGSPAASINGIEDLAKDGVKLVAVGIPESVPAGRYAKQALETAGLWDKLKGKIVQAKDVRQVLQYVETGNAEAGFVYETDAKLSDEVRVATEIDPSSHDPIEYPIGIVEDTDEQEASERFYEFLQGTGAAAVFQIHGFTIAP